MLPPAAFTRLTSLVRRNRDQRASSCSTAAATAAATVSGTPPEWWMRQVVPVACHSHAAVVICGEGAHHGAGLVWVVGAGAGATATGAGADTVGAGDETSDVVYDVVGTLAVAAAPACCAF